MADPKGTPAFAQHWANELGAEPGKLERLHGGINNQVFRCDDGRRKWVIKGYTPTQPGQRDRMQAELQFLRFAAKVAPGFTPAMIHEDQERRCVVLENLEGTTFREGVPPPPEAVQKAVQFVEQLNREPELARQSILLDAAEGFLSLRQHLANVRERVKAMDCQHLEPNIRPEAEVLLHDVRIELAQQEENISELIDKGLIKDKIHPDQRCISPSDFGFHNAINTATGVRFIDFEFAGWDDPAKASLDFILQPRVPVCNHGSPLLAAWLPDQRQAIEDRCKHLGPILQLKWLCILLAVLNPSRLEQMLAVMPEEKAIHLIQDRLKKVRRYLQRGQTF